MLRIGRINNRCLEGPIKLPDGPGDLMSKIVRCFNAFFQIWNETMVPKLIKQNKWYSSKSELKMGDIVFFQKVENDLASKWTLGRIDDVNLCF